MKNRRSSSMTFTSFVLSLLALVWAWVVLGQASIQRQYSSISEEEATKLVEKIVQNHEVPPPPADNPLNPSHWKLPEFGLHASGVKINDNDYIVFASARSDFVLYLGGREPGLVLNGVFFTTLDVEVVKNPVTENGETKKTISKGGYLWYLGAHGILLEKKRMNKEKGYDETVHTWIEFDKPIENFSTKTPLPLHLIDLSIPQGNNSGIVLKIGKRDIQLK